jgi:hypothetical protein
MNTGNFSKDIWDRISILKEECQKLYNGEDIKIVLTIDDGASLRWDDGMEFTEDDMVDNNHIFWNIASEQYEEQMKSRREVFQTRINAVCANSDKLADELGIDKTYFFENYIMA